MKIAIAGAGAMGCRFGFMLMDAGEDVTLIDGWQEHIEAICKKCYSSKQKLRRNIIPFLQLWLMTLRARSM